MKYFKVAFVDTMQHYRHRNPPWIKLYYEFWDDIEHKDFQRLPDVTKAHLVGLWLLASRTHNKIEMDVNWIQQKISATEPINFNLLFELKYLIEIKDIQDPISDASNIASADASNSARQLVQNARPETEREKKKSHAKACLVCVCVEYFDIFWDNYGYKIEKEKTIKQWNRIIKSGENPKIIAEDCTKNYNDWIESSGQLKKYPSTFLGPNNHWKEFIKPRHDLNVKPETKSQNDKALEEFLKNANERRKNGNVAP